MQIGEDSVLSQSVLMRRIVKRIISSSEGGLLSNIAQRVSIGKNYSTIDSSKIPASAARLHCRDWVLLSLEVNSDQTRVAALHDNHSLNLGSLGAFTATDLYNSRY